MAITPAGLPAWSRTADHTYYGGDLNKTNYQSQGAINPKTDVTAEQIVRAATDLAACVRVAPFCVITMTMADGSPDDPTVNSVLMMTGVNTVGYAGASPPTGFPTCTRQGTGYVRIQFSSSYADPYGVSEAWVVSNAQASLIGSTAGEITCQTDDINNRVEVFVFNSSGGALGDRQVTVEIH